MKARDRAVLRAVEVGVDTNLTRLNTNQYMLQEELEIMKDGKVLNAPLIHLESGLWDLVKVNMPKRISNSPTTLTQIRQSADAIAILNESIASRESFRLHNKALGAYSNILKNFDERILEVLASTRDQLEQLKSTLQGG